MIIPLGHEHTTVRRLPWVTFAVIAVCTVAFILTVGSLGGVRGKIEHRAQRAIDYYLQHPYLELDPRLEREIFKDVPTREIESFREVIQQFSGGDHPGADLIAEQQRRLDEMVDELFSAVRGTPFHTWGLVPGDPTAHGWITYMFMHGGWLHLIGNMLYLYLAAPFIEDRWGRPLFAGFYLGAGLFAAVAFAVRYPASETPLVGASGAIAGVMGAFLVLFWDTRIRFFYWFFTVFYGTFEAPAWLMLPLWFVGQLLMAQASDTMNPEGTGDGVAYLAHVAGFAFGLAAALLVRRLRIEERFIHPSIEGKITLVDNQAVEQAMEARAAGRTDEALEVLQREVSARPDNVDAAAALWDVARAAGRPGEAAGPLMTAMTAAVRRSDADFVGTYWPELVREAPEAVVDCGLAVRAAELLREQSRMEEARETTQAAARVAGSGTPPGVLVRLGRLADDLHVPLPGPLVDGVLRDPDLPPEVAELFAGLREDAQAGAGPETPGAAEEAPVEPIEPAAIPTHTLRVWDAVPRALAVGSLQIEVDGQMRSLDLGTVQAVAVGGISGEGDRPYLLVDLLLDPVWGEQPHLRVVRFRSTRFDPRTLVGGDDAMGALRVMLSELLQTSEAEPLPDPDGARGTPFRVYGSLADYQQQVLGST